MAKMNISRREVFIMRLLDVEQAYREYGWNVKYDKPGFNESYESFFIFKKPK